MCIEIVQHIAFHCSLSPQDVVSLCLTSKTMHSMILGEIHTPHPYDVDQLKSLAGVGECVRRGWWRAAMIAVKRGYGDVEEEWEDRESGRVNVIVAAVAAGKEELVRVLLDHPDVDPVRVGTTGVSLIREAVVEGHVDILRVLLEDGRCDPGEDDNGAIGNAAMNGKVEIVQVLLEDPRVDPGGGEDYAIRWASWFGQADVVSLLLAHPSVDPAADRNAPIKDSWENAHLDVVAILAADPRVSVPEECLPYINNLVGEE